jgi:hypothetical protein
MNRSIALFAALFAVACGSDEKTTGDSGTTDTNTTDTNTTDTTPACFTTCADFCAGEIVTCPETYADEAACLAECDAWACGTEDDTAGNTLACRVYHLGAAQTDAATHCPHTAADGGGVCVD